MTDTNNKKKIFIIASVAAAILLAAAAVFLFALNGIRSADFTRFPVPEQYYNVCLSPGGMLSEQFRAPATGMRGVSIYVIVDEEMSQEGLLTASIADVSEGGGLLAEGELALSDIHSAEWCYIPFQTDLKKDHTYEIRYTLDAPETAEVWFILFAEEEQQAFARWLSCDKAVLDGSAQDACIFQVLHVLHPTGRGFNLILFVLLCGILFAVLYTLAGRTGVLPGAREKLAAVFEQTDTGFRSICSRYALPICAVVAALLAVLIRLPLVALESGDYNGYLLPWIDHYQRWGIVDGLASLPGNYYVPYNLFLALISKLPVPPYWPIAVLGFAGDFLLAFYGARIARFLGEKNGLADASIRVHAAVTFFALILLPPVFLDSAAWKQADTIYIGFLVATVYYALKDRYFTAFLMLGISFMFKLQAIFLLPFLIILYFCRRFPLAYFLIPPAFYLLGGLPAILCGGEPRYIYMRYMSQTSDAPVMTSMFPNVYNFGLYGYDWLKVPSILFTLFSFVTLFLLCVRHAEAINSARTLQLAALCIWICVMFLPSMHQRYGLGVSVFLVIAFLSDVRNRTLAVITVTAVLVETMVFAGYLFAENDGVPLLVQTFLYVGIFFVYAWRFITGLTASKAGESAEEN